MTSISPEKALLTGNNTNEGATLRIRGIAYWVITSILVFRVLSGGIAELAHKRENVEGIVHLGYPIYFVTLIGFWKVLGGLALLVPRLPRLKEWAYAGIFFNMTGAAVSHAARGDATWHVAVTIIFAVVTLASWALRSPSRTLGITAHNQASVQPIS